jgi:regulator of sigma E protease
MGIGAAGPLFNFLFAIIAFSLIYSIGVPVSTSKVGSVLEKSAALRAGIQKGDRIIGIDGKDVSRWAELVDIIGKSNGRQLKLTIDRSNQVRDVYVIPETIKVKNIFGEEVQSCKIGIAISSETVIERLNPFLALIEGADRTWWFTKLTLLTVVKIVERVVSPKTLGGPILIAQMSGQYAKQGFIPFIFFMSVLSINLGVLNLLPIPVLDGGHLFFYLIEIITGKEVNVKWREMSQQLGFFLLVLLMIFVFYNDIARILGN